MHERGGGASDLMSDALAEFSNDVQRSAVFFGALYDIAGTTDHLANAAAAQLLRERGADHPDRKAWEASLREPHRRLEWFRSHQDLLVEFLVTRAVDQFLTYTTRLLASAYRAKPEMLKSSEQVRVEDVLRYRTMEDLVEYLAEQQVNRLAYRSLGDLAEYLEDRLGFAMFRGPEERAEAVRLVELRNLIVHNGRRVNRTYLTRVAGATAKLGELLPINPQAVRDLVVLVDIADRMDQLAEAKFGVPRNVAGRPFRMSEAEKASLTSSAVVAALAGLDGTKRGQAKVTRAGRPRRNAPG